MRTSYFHKSNSTLALYTICNFFDNVTGTDMGEYFRIASDTLPVRHQIAFSGDTPISVVNKIIHNLHLHMPLLQFDFTKTAYDSYILTVDPSSYIGD